MASEKSPYGTADISKKRKVVVKANAEEELRIFEALQNDEFKQAEKAAKERVKLEEELQTKIAKLRADSIEGSNDKELEAKQAELDALLELDENYARKKQELEDEARTVALTRAMNDARYMNAAQIRETSKTLAEELKQKEKALDAAIAARKKKLDDPELTEEARSELQTKLTKDQKDLENIKKQRAIAQDMSTRLSKKDFLGSFLSGAGRKSLLEGAHERTVNAQQRVDFAKVDVDETREAYLNKLANLKKDVDDAKKQVVGAITPEEKTAAEERKRIAEEELKRYEEHSDEKKAMDAAEKELSEATHERNKRQLAETGDALAAAAAQGLSTFMASAGRSIESNLDSLFGPQGKMMGRLQGLKDANGELFDWAETVDEVSDTIGFSGVVSKKSVVSKMVELVDSGVAYNIEMRAFLAETAENIASTFSATNGTLLRLIRIQQQDTTAARLGMEATLTKLFNGFFNDTSYLAENVSDTISSTLLDAYATMTRDGALEFEYTIQKWLGALYSLGMSQEGVNKIAQGIGYLATGNVSALNSDTSLQTLLAMSASRANKSYAGLLLGDLSAEETNDLLKAMVEYLAEIASSQSNYVTKSAYADLFGMSLTDLNSFTSLTKEEMESLYKSTVSYTSLMEETKDQLNQVTNRIHLTKLVDNAFENALVGAASTIGSNAFLYGTWKTLAVLKEYVGEIKVPGIIGMGTGVSSGLDILNLAQTGMVGMGLLGSILGGIGSMFNGGPTNFDYIKNAWNYQESTTRGGTLSILQTGDTFNDKSYSAKLGVGSQSGEDAEAVALQSGMDKGDTVTSDEMEEQKEIYQKIYEALSMDDGAITVLTMLGQINERLDPNRVFYTASLGSVSSRTANTIMQLSSQLTAAGATVSGGTDTEQNITTSSNTLSTDTTGVGGTGTTLANTELITLEDTIQMAVRTALETLLGTYEHTGIPVRLTTTSI